MQYRIEVTPRYLSPVLIVILLLATSVRAAAEQTASTANSLPAVSGVFMKVRLEPSIRLSGLKPGAVVTATRTGDNARGFCLKSEHRLG